MGMYSLYLDDSRKRINKCECKIWGGYIAQESEMTGILKQFEKIKNKWGLKKNDPVKWSPEKNNVKYNPQRGLSKQNEFKIEILNLIASSPITLMAAVIEANGRIDEVAMDEQLINDLSVRFQFFLQEQKRFWRRGFEESGAIVLAYPGHSQAKRFSEHFHRIWSESATLISKNFERVRPVVPVKLNYLDGGMYFSYESENASLQLADFISSSICWTLYSGKDHYFNIIKSKFRKIRGTIKGAGILIYPSNSVLIDELCA